METNQLKFTACKTTKYLSDKKIRENSAQPWDICFCREIGR